MAKSKAQKKREHDVRNGKRDVSLNRGGDYISISTHERKTPTKKEILSKRENKYKRKFGDYAS